VILGDLGTQQIELSHGREDYVVPGLYVRSCWGLNSLEQVPTSRVIDENFQTRVLNYGMPVEFTIRVAFLKETQEAPLRVVKACRDRTLRASNDGEPGDRNRVVSNTGLALMPTACH
jgi:hypothetical protein